MKLKDAMQQIKKTPKPQKIICTPKQNLKASHTVE